jgi:hypothetical protein
MTDGPVSRAVGPTIEQLADIERAGRDMAEAAETLVPCPACEHCDPCRGTHMVPIARAASMRETPGLDEPGDDHA